MWPCKRFITHCSQSLDDDMPHRYVIGLRYGLQIQLQVRAIYKAYGQNAKLDRFR